MEHTLQLVKKIAPDLTEELIKRYRVLKTVRLLQPCGRRLVVLSLGMTERTVRSEIERLSAQNLVHVSKIGMSLTEEGMEVLEGLERIFSALTGLSILEEKLAAGNVPVVVIGTEKINGAYWAPHKVEILEELVQTELFDCIYSDEWYSVHVPVE